MKQKVFKNQFGSSMVGALVALGCIAVMISASVNFFINARKTTQTMLQLNVRDKIQSTLKRVVRIPTSIRVSHNKPGNEALKNCLLMLVVYDIDDVGDCENNKWIPFDLYGPMIDTSSAMTSTSSALAGRTPVEYNNLGAAVTSGEAVFMKVRAWFRAQCPPPTYLADPAPVCDIAETLEFRYSIESNAVDSAGATKLRSLTENSVIASKDVDTRVGFEPRIKPEFRDPSTLPPPPPPPPPNSPPSVPLAPIVCRGDTYQTGPNQCSCPPGEVLYNPRRGKCGKISR